MPCFQPANRFSAWPAMRRILFGIFGGLYLAFSHIYQPQSIKEKREQNLADSNRREQRQRRVSPQESTNPPIHQSPSPHSPVRVGPRHGTKLPPIDWPRLFK